MTGVHPTTLLKHLEGVIEQPEMWDYWDEETRKREPYWHYLKMLEQTYIRKQAEREVEQALMPRSVMKQVSPSEVKSRPVPNWIVPGIIQESGITVLVGPSGAGKSFFSIAMTNAVATGTPFFGRPTVKGRVLYIAGEGTAAFGNRLKAWDHVNGDIVPDDAVQYIEEGVNLSDDAGIDTLARMISDRNFSLIIVDTFSQLSGVTNANDERAVAEFYTRMKRLRDANPGSAVLVIHHTNKAGQSARGSGVHKDNVDVHAVLRGTSVGFSISTLSDHNGKIKDGQEEEWHGFKLQPVLDSCVVVNDGGRVSPVSPHWDVVRGILADGAEHPSRELYEACGIPSSTSNEYTQWSRLMKSWVKDGLITKTGTTRATYSMPPMPGPDPLPTPAPNEMLSHT